LFTESAAGLGVSTSWIDTTSLLHSRQLAQDVATLSALTRHAQRARTTCTATALARQPVQVAEAVATASARALMPSSVIA
jgi:hypothetical protein